MGKCSIIGAECPRTNDPEAKRYCPAWQELAETNVQTGEERIIKDCWFRIAPRWLTEVVRASNRPSAAVESLRNEMTMGLVQLAMSRQQLPPPGDEYHD